MSFTEICICAFKTNSSKDADSSLLMKKNISESTWMHNKCFIEYRNEQQKFLKCMAHFKSLYDNVK